MQFQSWTFLLFFIPVLLLYWAVRGTRLRIPVLLAASYVFYASFNVYFLICLGVVTIVDYLVALQLSRHRSRWLVCVSLLVDLGMLCSFKYIPRVTDFDWVLPVGLSFFTFKSISYVIDVYRGKIAVERNLLAYAAYVAFFPQLVAGPIDRATTLLPQLHHNVPLRIDDVSEGFSLFVTGLFKKAVMADMLAVYVNVVYEDVTSYSGAMRLLAAYAYAWQIYFDFSGYSDMACGIARCMGFRCMLNFNNPYVSVDVRDFWRRWHISLSTWFRDYVYIPMGGSRCGKLRNWFNVIVTMLVSGAWHGATWTFVAWGGLHGVGSVVSSWFDKSGWYGKIPKIIKQIAVFHFMTLTWIFFRAESFEDAFDVIRGIVTWEEGDFFFPPVPFVLIGLVWIYELTWASRFRWILETRAARIAAAVFVLVCVLLLGGGANSQFIYQQF